jgi:hypothetical protein
MNVTMKAFHVHVRGNPRLQEEEIEEQSAGNDMAWTCARGNGTWQSIFVYHCHGLHLLALLLLASASTGALNYHRCLLSGACYEKNHVYKVLG